MMTGKVNQLGTLNIHQSMTAEAIMARQMNHRGQQAGENISMTVPATIVEQKPVRKQTKGRAKAKEGRKNNSSEPRKSGLRGSPPVGIAKIRNGLGCGRSAEQLSWRRQRLRPPGRRSCWRWCPGR